jgi:hypothetical protein
MTWLENENVARQLLAAKSYRRYPNSGRPTSEDRRMIFLGIAVAAGIFGRSFSTTLRKLAEANLGIEHIAEEVHAFDRLKEMVIANSMVWAEPVSNYFWPLADGEWMLRDDLPCEVPKDWQGGFIIHGYGRSGPLPTFSRTLPIELAKQLGTQATNQVVLETANITSPTKTNAPNHVVCKCGATIAAASRRIALKALAEHKRIAHGLNRRP